MLTSGQVLATFSSVVEASEFLGVAQGTVYQFLRTPNRKRIHNNNIYTIEFVGVKVMTEAEREAELRAKETEDETRKRLQITPYGKHNDEEWFNQMLKRVQERLYPDGYSEHDEFLRRKAVRRQLDGKMKPRGVEEDVPDDLDEFML